LKPGVTPQQADSDMNLSPRVSQEFPDAGWGSYRELRDQSVGNVRPALLAILARAVSFCWWPALISQTYADACCRPQEFAVRSVDGRAPMRLIASSSMRLMIESSVVQPACSGLSVAQDRHRIAAATFPAVPHVRMIRMCLASPRRWRWDRSCCSASVPRSRPRRRSAQALTRAIAVRRKDAAPAAFATA